MEGWVFQNQDTYWDDERGRPKGVTKPSRGQRPRDGVSIAATALKGRADRLAEWLDPFREEREAR